jgi:predicted amidohydrolase
MTKFKIALAQISPVLGDIEKNVKKHLQYCDKAIKKGADLVVFPELSLTGYSVKDLNMDLALDPYTADILQPLRDKSSKIDIICGGIEEDENYGIFNSAFYMSDGVTKYTHKKIYPPDYGMFEEMRYFSRGKEVDVLDTKFGKVGILICEDLWHMSLPYLQALKGAKVIITIAASPTKLQINTPKGRKPSLKNYEINSEHHKAYARLLSTYVIFCNRVGYEDGVNFWGGSEIVDATGCVTKLAPFLDEELLVGEINMNNVKRARQLARHFLDEDVNALKTYVKNLYEEVNKL